MRRTNNKKSRPITPQELKGDTKGVKTEDKADKQQEFVELRAKGNSYDRIAKKLGVSKGTLIQWSKELKIDIGNYIALEADALLDKYKMSKLSQLESYGTQLEKIRKEFEKRDLSEVPTPKLVEMQLKIMGAASRNDRTEVVLRSEDLSNWYDHHNWRAN